MSRKRYFLREPVGLGMSTGCRRTSHAEMLREDGCYGGLISMSGGGDGGGGDGGGGEEVLYSSG